MRKLYETNRGIDIYIDLRETSYHDPETQEWLWDEAKIVYSGRNTSPLMYSDGKVIIGYEDDGHIWFDNDSLTLSVVYFESLLRDGQILLKTLEKQS